MEGAFCNSLYDTLTRVAYLRDSSLQGLLGDLESVARLTGDTKEAERIAKLRDFWDEMDKGALGETELGRAALNVVRTLRACGTYDEDGPPEGAGAGDGLTERERVETETELARQLLDAAKSKKCDFELALARAKRFCAKPDLRSILAFHGVIRELKPGRPPWPVTPEELMQDFAPGVYRTLLHAEKNDNPKRVQSIKRNWRKLLEKTKVFPKQKRGRPRKGTD